MKMENKGIQLAIANALVEELWLEGLLTEEEKNNIQKKNEEKILN